MSRLLRTDDEPRTRRRVMSENAKKTQAKTNGQAKKQDGGFQPFVFPFFDLDLVLEAGRKRPSLRAS